MAISGKQGVVTEMQRIPLRAQVAREIRRLLLIGYFVPGSRITELGIAELLKVSRTPAREALTLLGESGVLQALPGGGFAIPLPTPQEIGELYVLRELLEVPALRLAINGQRTATPTGLRECLHDLYASQNDVTTASFMEGFLRFRVLMFTDCGNDLLERTIHRLDNQTEAMKAHALAEPAVRDLIVATYSDLTDAFEARDAARATALLRRHHGHGRDAYEAVARKLEQAQAVRPRAAAAQ